MFKAKVLYLTAVVAKRLIKRYLPGSLRALVVSF